MFTITWVLHNPLVTLIPHLVDRYVVTQGLITSEQRQKGLRLCGGLYFSEINRVQSVPPFSYSPTFPVPPHFYEALESLPFSARPPDTPRLPHPPSHLCLILQSSPCQYTSPFSPVRGQIATAAFQPLLFLLPAWFLLTCGMVHVCLVVHIYFLPRTQPIDYYYLLIQVL